VRDLQRWLKDLLNEQAGIRLAQLGHSDPMIRDAKREAWWWLKARGAAVRNRTGLVSGRAVVWTAPGRVELLAVEIPKARGAEVTVELVATVVSPGTERAEYLRLPNTAVSFPMQPGYSGAGRVIATGAEVSNVSLGDLVAVRNVRHASVATVSVRSIHAVPDGVPVEAAALVQLGVICSHGVRRAEVSPGEPVCVIGSGTVGALVQRIAVAVGAGPVTVVARSRAKEAVAHAGGATRFLVVEEDAEEIARLASPVVIEASGDPDAVELALLAAGDSARVVLLGSPRGVTGDMPVSAIRSKRAHIVGAHVSALGAQGRLRGTSTYQDEARAFFDLVSSGALTVDELTGTAVDPREADAFYRRLATSRDIVGARFDWTLLPREDRVAEGRLLRLPDLTGSGADFAQRPLPPGGRRSKSLYGRADPFAGASGRLRIGLVGCGEIAVRNARGITAAPNVELVACYDPVHALAEDIAKTFGGEPTSTSAALLERPDVDAVLLSVPHHLHGPLGAEAAGAGKHVIVEKPLANNLQAAVDLVDAVERAGVLLSVCFPMRYQPDVVVARALIEAGALGEPAGVLLNFFMDKPPSYWFGGFSGRAHSDWRTSRRLAGGGVLIVNLCHYVDLVRHLIGVEADLVSAATSTAEEPADVEDIVSVSAKYANGALGSFFGTAALRGSAPSEELRVWGPDGQIAIEPRPLVYTLRALDGLVTGRWQTFGRRPRSNQRAVYLSRLATAIDRGDEPDVTARDGLAVQAFIEAAYRSGESEVAVSPTSLLEEVGS
jgi:UDP-N-acetyl-2-amino-2-deoxyglucuronate dehydrogenase